LKLPASLNDQQYQIAVAIGALLLMLVIGRMRFCYELELPGKPPKPEVTVMDAHAVARSIERTPGAYNGYLEKDSKAYGVVPIATPDDMGKVLEYQVDRNRKVLYPGDENSYAEVLGLHLTVSLQEMKNRQDKQMVLGIESSYDHPVAYRVQTRPTKGTKACHKKQDLAHNAIALAGGGAEMRSECIYREGWGIEIKEVEVIKLSPLQHVYVSNLVPEKIGLEARSARGHKPAVKQRLCHMVSAAAVYRALEAGATTWRDMIDFYARHRCQTYSFPKGYKAFESDDERPLPVVDEG
jgi:hypothetical protein